VRIRYGLSTLLAAAFVAAVIVAAVHTTRTNRARRSAEEAYQRLAAFWAIGEHRPGSTPAHDIEKLMDNPVGAPYLRRFAALSNRILYDEERGALHCVYSVRGDGVTSCAVSVVREPRTGGHAGFPQYLRLTRLSLRGDSIAVEFSVSPEADWAAIVEPYGLRPGDQGEALLPRDALLEGKAVLAVARRR
jgi:hypothetical protein